MRRANFVTCATLLVALTAPGALTAQTGFRIGGGGAWEHYSFRTPAAIDIESLSLTTAPFAAELGVGNRWTLRLAGAYASASLARPDGTESTLSGLTDTEASVRLDLGGGSAAITAMALLPTGKSTLTYDELFVAGAIAADVLPFRVANWGTGGGVGASIALARPLGSFAAGFSIGYVVARTFEPIEAEPFEYRPGNQFHVRVALDRTMGSAGKAALQLGYQRFSADQGDGSNLFQAGDRKLAVASYDFAAGSSRATLYAGWLSRGEGEFVDEIDLLPAQELFYTGAGMRAPIGGATLQPAIELRVLSSDGADRSGYTLSAGGSLELPTGVATWVPTVRGRLGRIEARAGGDSGFTGIELGLAVRFGAVER
jgi:hypothetical protein